MLDHGTGTQYRTLPDSQRRQHRWQSIRFCFSQSRGREQRRERRRGYRFAIRVWFWRCLHLLRGETRDTCSERRVRTGMSATKD